MAVGRLAVSLGVLSLSSAAAIAADLSLPPRPYAPYAPAYYHPAVVYEWTGFYIGLSAGGGFGLGGIDISAVPITFDTQPSGFIGGGQIGYNYQMGPVVWGVEADFSGADINGSASKTIVDTITGTANQKLDWLGTLRGRVGVVPFTPLLVYATGGLAYGHVSADVTLAQACSCGPSSTASASISSTQWGWTAGGGVEWLFAPHWSVKAEFLYYNLGHVSANMTLTQLSGATPIGISSTVDAKGDIARGGINYKF